MDERRDVDMDDDQPAARESGGFGLVIQIPLFTKALSLPRCAGTCCGRSHSSRPVPGRRLADLGPDDVVACVTQTDCQRGNWGQAGWAECNEAQQH